MNRIPPITLSFFGGPKTRANYQLTALGKTKAEEFHIPGPKGVVVMALENIGPCTESEISNEAKMLPERVKHIVQMLIRDGWVIKVTGE